ncbi:MAG: hydrogenase/urease maturation nickel metallochaperone HypA [Planctomycetota bacterium]
MHELSIATELYAACRREVEGRGGGRIEAVTVAVGELSAGEPALLGVAWEALTGEGADRGARLSISSASSTRPPRRRRRYRRERDGEARPEA